jgi:hypothetical protein
MTSSAKAKAREQLDLLIDRYLAGDLSLGEFQRSYSDRYMEDDGCADFNAAELDHYAAVNQRAEWTAEPFPTEEERSYGWIDPSELKTWLTIHESHKPPQ